MTAQPLNLDDLRKLSEKLHELEVAAVTILEESARSRRQRLEGVQVTGREEPMGMLLHEMNAAAMASVHVKTVLDPDSDDSRRKMALLMLLNYRDPYGQFPPFTLRGTDSTVGNSIVAYMALHKKEFVDAYKQLGGNVTADIESTRRFNELQKIGEQKQSSKMC